MKSGRRFLVPLTLLSLLVALALGQRAVERAAIAQNRGAGEAPRFEVDPLWPAIPASINMGEVSSVAVDRNDHVWILHRPDSGPAVLEFDSSGRYLGGWGGPRRRLRVARHRARHLRRLQGQCLGGRQVG